MGWNSRRAATANYQLRITNYPTRACLVGAAAFAGRLWRGTGGVEGAEVEDVVAGGGAGLLGFDGDVGGHGEGVSALDDDFVVAEREGGGDDVDGAGEHFPAAEIGLGTGGDGGAQEGDA